MEENPEKKKRGNKAAWKKKLLEARERQLVYKKKAALYLKRFKKLRSRHESKVEELTEKAQLLESLQRELEESRDRNLALQDQLQCSQEELRALQSTEAANSETLSMVGDLETELALVEKEKARVEELLREREAHGVTVAQEIDEVQGELDRTRGLVTDLRAQLCEAEERVKAGELQLGKRYESHRKASAEVKKLRDQTWAQREEIKALKSELSDAKQSLSRIQAEMRSKGRSR